METAETYQPCLSRMEDAYAQAGVVVARLIGFHTAGGSHNGLKMDDLLIGLPPAVASDAVVVVGMVEAVKVLSRTKCSFQKERYETGVTQSEGSSYILFHLCLLFIKLFTYTTQ